jgi:hypothetical protein
VNQKIYGVIYFRECPTMKCQRKALDETRELIKVPKQDTNEHEEKE